MRKKGQSVNIIWSRITSSSGHTSVFMVFLRAFCNLAFFSMIHSDLAVLLLIWREKWLLACFLYLFFFAFVFIFFMSCLYVDYLKRCLSVGLELSLKGTCLAWSKSRLSSQYCINLGTVANTCNPRTRWVK